MTRTRVPRFDALVPRSTGASTRARGASLKRDTKPELRLRRSLHAAGLRYRVDVAALPGRPDIVFPSAKVVVFVDGDFWHGRDITGRLQKLAGGHNAPYWTAKIRSNVERDARHNLALEHAGWKVVRVWESAVTQDLQTVTDRIIEMIRAARAHRGRRHE